MVGRRAAHPFRLHRAGTKPQGVPYPFAFFAKGWARLHLSAAGDMECLTEEQMKPTCFQVESMQMPAIHILKASCTRKWRVWLAMTLLATLGFAGTVFCHAQRSTTPACDNSTVADAWGPEFASQARAFLAELQHVVRSNDKTKFSSLVQYPVHVFEGNHGTEIATPAGLIRRYTSIMTPALKRAVLTQSSECLFGNGQGAMVGGGRIWFQRQSGGK